jgi:AraC-like DNA-binding protein
MAAPISVPIHPALVPYVREITVEARPVLRLPADRVAPAPYRILPGIAPVIGFQFRGRVSVLRDTRAELLGRSGVTGIQSTARWFLSEAETRSVIVRLAPFGGYVLLNQCMAELADRQVPLDQIMGGMEPLEDELQQLGPHQAVERVHKWLLERLSARKRDVHPDVIATWRALIDTAGRSRVEVIAKDIGIGRRRLERLFQRQIGVAPKELALLVRFERVVHEQGRRSWTDIALDTGYADQAHFIRDFKQRTGMTPTEFRRDQPR